MRIVLMAILILTYSAALPDIPPTNNPANKRAVEHTTQDYIPRHGSLDERLEVAQAYSNRCFTAYLWCLLPGQFPVGSACWCASPNGPVPGVVR